MCCDKLIQCADALDNMKEREITNMANKFDTDILIQAPDPMTAAFFYVKQLGFEITGETPNMISLHGAHINLFIEQGPALGPVLEVTVDSIEEAKARLVKNGCEIVKDEPDFPAMLCQKIRSA